LLIYRKNEFSLEVDRDKVRNCSVQGLIIKPRAVTNQVVSKPVHYESEEQGREMKSRREKHKNRSRYRGGYP